MGWVTPSIMYVIDRCFVREGKFAHANGRTDGPTDRRTNGQTGREEGGIQTDLYTGRQAGRQGGREMLGHEAIFREKGGLSLCLSVMPKHTCLPAYLCYHM